MALICEGIIFFCLLPVWQFADSPIFISQNHHTCEHNFKSSITTKVKLLNFVLLHFVRRLNMGFYSIYVHSTLYIKEFPILNTKKLTATNIFNRINGNTASRWRSNPKLLAVFLGIDPKEIIKLTRTRLFYAAPVPSQWPGNLQYYCLISDGDVGGFIA